MDQRERGSRGNRPGVDPHVGERLRHPHKATRRPAVLQVQNKAFRRRQRRAIRTINQTLLNGAKTFFDRGRLQMGESRSAVLYTHVTDSVMRLSSSLGPRSLNTMSLRS